MASKGNILGIQKVGSNPVGNVDFLKNLKLENKTRAFSSSNKASFIQNDSPMDSRENSERPAGSNQEYADHLIEHNEQWNQKKTLQF